MEQPTANNAAGSRRNSRVHDPIQRTDSGCGAGTSGLLGRICFGLDLIGAENWRESEVSIVEALHRLVGSLGTLKCGSPDLENGKQLVHLAR